MTHSLTDESAKVIHLIRHGEVHNPGGVVYGRLPGFDLSSTGARTAALAAAELGRRGRVITTVLASPLERAVQSAQPIADAFGVAMVMRPGLTEAQSHLEGGRFDVSLRILAEPKAWRYLINPLRPTWGEPFSQVFRRIHSELDWARRLPGTGDIAIVTHQLPIWVIHRRLAGKPLAHDPRRRRCALSSITSLEYTAGGFRETGYWQPSDAI